MIRSAYLVAAVLISQSATAGGLIGDIIRGVESDIIKDASTMDSAHSPLKDNSEEATALRALSICQSKCSICFDGVDCDFECVKQTCLKEQGVKK